MRDLEGRAFTMIRRTLRTGALIVAVAVLAAGCSGGSQNPPPTGSGSGGPKQGGILRIGTINYIDSFNPFHYIEAQAFQAMIMLFPQLVQYTYDPDGFQIEGDWATSWTTSADGKDWTFKLIPGAKWSDGQPMTADDAAWTINTTVKYRNGPTAVAAPALGHVSGAEAPDDSTLVIHYKQPVGNVLAQLEQLFIVPRHVWQPLMGSDGRGLKTYQPDQHLPIVVGGAYTLKSYDKKGTTVFLRNPDFYGPPSNAEAVALTYYTNSDSMIADLQAGQLDWVDQVPFNAVDVLKKNANIVVDEVPGAETTNVTWNSNPRKPLNRELLDPNVKKAISMCIDRQQIIDVVFNGYADSVESLVGHISPLENPNLGPLQYDCAAGNQMLDQLGYTKGPDGIRVAPATTGQYPQAAHPMKYEILTPTSTDFNVDRAFEIVKQGFAAAGVQVSQKVGGDTTATYALETDENCDASTSTGYSKFDIAMWDWIGYIDPDFMLSVVTKAQWCSWSDTGWEDPQYDQLYEQQGVTVDQNQRRDIVYQMQQMIYDQFLYTQLVNEKYIDAHSKSWTGIEPNLNAYSKKYWTDPYQTG
jgi:peptide/nickel transport system substrate-binding protein